MAHITNRGRKLASKLNPMIGTTTAIQETCSLIARHARTYQHYQEIWTNQELSDNARDRLQERENRLEKRILDLVDSLPDTDEGPIETWFSGDPRGFCVKLNLPGSYKRYAEVWDGESIGADVD